jgi:hypothetical protein
MVPPFDLLRGGACERNDEDDFLAGEKSPSPLVYTGFTRVSLWNKWGIRLKIPIIFYNITAPVIQKICLAYSSFSPPRRLKKINAQFSPLADKKIVDRVEPPHEPVGTVSPHFKSFIYKH